MNKQQQRQATTHRIIDGVRVWGDPDERTLAQIQTCKRAGDATAAALMADAHLGYSMPIGGVVAYPGYVSPSGVGFDIACGILAVQTPLLKSDIEADLGAILDEIASRISFGLGRTNPDPIDHALFDDPLWREDKNIARLKDRAYHQLGTVGSGNHFVDLLVDLADERVWVAAHFGSRGFGHAVASGFINLAKGRAFADPLPRESMDAPPVLLRANSPLGEAYIQAMQLAGRYAYAGREHVIDQVLAILGTHSTKTVHNHHNFAWLEKHDGESVWVIRKGATPAFPGQEGFVGGSMGDIAAVVAGVDTKENRLALRSTIHGAGRIMSRSAAKGRVTRRGVVKRPPQVTPAMMRERLRKLGVQLRGGDVDEAPQVYRPLRHVLKAHAGSIEIRHLLQPVGVVMAGKDVFDPYKD